MSDATSDDGARRAPAGDMTLTDANSGLAAGDGKSSGLRAVNVVHVNDNRVNGSHH